MSGASKQMIEWPSTLIWVFWLFWPTVPYLLVVDIDLHNGVDVEDGGVSAETLALQRQIFVGVEIRHIRFGQDDVVGVRHHV